MPRVVFLITGSQSLSSAGRMKITRIILIIAPRAIRIHMELIMSIS